MMNPAEEKNPYHLAICMGGGGDCPNAVTNLEELCQKIQNLLDSSEWLPTSSPFPLLFHQRFKLVLAGCVNGCSRPQIVDFGVIGKGEIGIKAELCSGCRACEKACREGAISFEGNLPLIN